jgi:hypothetical protein
MGGMALHLFFEMVDSQEKGRQTSQASGMSPHIYIFVSLYTTIHIYLFPIIFGFHSSLVFHWAVLENKKGGEKTESRSTLVFFGIWLHVVEWKLSVSLLTARPVRVHPLWRFVVTVVTFALQVAPPRSVLRSVVVNNLFDHRGWCKLFSSPASGADRNELMEIQ